MDPRFSQEAIAFAQSLAEVVVPYDNGYDINWLRECDVTLFQKYNEKLLETFKGTLQEKKIKTNSTEIPVTIYTPVDVNKEKLGIYFHGGGWVASGRMSHQPIVNYLADATKTVWILVEYRLAPEYKYPIWLDDASNVAQYIIENKTSFGVNQSAKVGVAGESNGATISASLARSLKNIDFQILINGVFDLSLETESAKEFASPIYGSSPRFVNWIKSVAFNNIDDTKDPRVAALLNTSFEGLPPCLLIPIELDIFRDNSYEYQKLLEKAGVQTKLVLIKGVFNGFLRRSDYFPQACEQMLNAIRDFMASI